TLTTLGVFALALAAVRLSPDSAVSAWWPASGVAVLGLIALRRGAAWATCLVLAGVAVTAANLVGGRAVDTSVGFGLAAVIESALVLAPLRRGRAAPPLSLARSADLSRLMRGTAVGVVVSFVVVAAT